MVGISPGKFKKKGVDIINDKSIKLIYLNKIIYFILLTE
jgi:hypothetical protein